MKTIAIYLRVSHESQVEKNGTDLQRTEINRWIAQNGMRKGAIKIYEDLGISGASIGKRPSFKRLMDDIDRGAVSTLIVYKIDRLSRSMHDSVRVLQHLSSKKVRLISVTENVNFGNGAMGEFVYNLMAAVSNLFRSQLSERIKHGLAAKRASDPNFKAGRPRDNARLDMIAKMRETMSCEMIAAKLKISRQSVHASIRRRKSDKISA